METRTGVRGFWDWKFWVVASLYFLACVFFYQTGMNRHDFAGVFSICIAYIVMSTIAWEYQMIGSPHRPHSLVLHLLFGVVLVFAFNTAVFSLGRTFGDSGGWFTSMMGMVPVTGSELAAGISSFLGGIVASLFTTLLSVALFFIVPLVLSLKRSWSLPVLLILFFLLALLTVRLSLVSAVWMLAGMVAMFVGLGLQREDEQQGAFWRMVRRRLDIGDRQARIDSRIKLDLLGRLFDNRSLDETQIRGVVSKRLRCSPDDPRLVEVCRRFLEQLTVQENLVEIRTGAHGQYIVLKDMTPSRGLFLKLALIPKMAIVVVFSVLYILSPIDLIPDYIPVFGVVDDLAVGVFGAMSLFMTRENLARTKRSLGDILFRRET